jgi:tRNA/tmRNA/rRNA uracil-C5-methylase (TrmA/RlmC/RlmD family)
MVPVTASVSARPLPGDVLELTVGEAVHGGWCVARPDDRGQVVFVRHALPGERVRAAVTQVTAKLARADAVEILDPSPDRVPPPCPHARPGGCGGCDWQHASLPAQRQLKAAVIRQQLARIAGLDREVTVEALPGDQPDAAAPGLGWRTRVSFAVGPDGRAGLHQHRSHKIVHVGECPIAHAEVNDLGVTAETWPGAASVLAAAVPEAGERGVLITAARRSPSRSRSQSRPSRPGAPPRLGSLPPVTADSVATVAPSGARAAVAGRGYLTHQAAGRPWRVDLAGFWQVHPAAADTLAAAVLQALEPRPGDVALDLYCGAGLFAGVLAPEVGPEGRVIGVESDPATVRDARHNLREWPWARVHRGDVAEVLGRIGLSGASLVVLDPPRAGAAPAVIDALTSPHPGPAAEPPSEPRPVAEAGASPVAGSESGPGSGSGSKSGAESGPETRAGASSLRRIAYVSCDPATLARDLGLLIAGGWTLDALRAFDAFPMTHHVECLATLSR